jgi:hypothetical protein
VLAEIEAIGLYLLEVRQPPPGPVYGFSNAATHSWATPSTCGFLAAGVVLGVVFAWWQGWTANPLLPPHVVLDRNRGGAYLSMLIAAAQDARRNPDVSSMAIAAIRRRRFAAAVWR